MQTVSDTDSYPTKKRRGRVLSSRWRWWFLLLVVLGTVYFLPTIVARTPLLGVIVGSVSSGQPVAMSVGEASLGWFSPVVVSEIEVHDQRGELVAQIPRVRVSKSLISLIADSSDLGTIEITDSQFFVRTENGVSQLESLLVQPVSEPSGESSETAVASTPTKYQLTWTNCVIRVVELSTKRQWSLEDFSGEYNPSADSIRCQGLVKDGQQVGKLELTGELTPAFMGNCQIQTQNVPIGMLELVAARAGHAIAVQGTLNGLATATLQPSHTEIQCNLEADGIDVQDLSIDGGAGWHGGLVKASGRLQFNGKTWSAQQAVVTTDWGQLLASGTLPESLVPLKASQPWEARGTIDLAKIAQAFPKLLRIREGARVEQGRLSVQLSGDASRLAGDVHLTDIEALVDGRREAWAQPLQIVFRGSVDANRFQIDHATCRSTFLSANGTSSGNQSSVQFALDWNQLSRDLTRFVDLGGNQVSGITRGTVIVAHVDSKQHQLAGNLISENIKWSTPTATIVSEPKIESQFQADVLFDEQNAQIRALTGTARTADSSLACQNNGSLSLAENAAWPLKIQAQGQLAKLWSYVRALTPLEDHQIAGEGTFIAALSLGSERTEVSAFNVDVTNFEVTGPLTQIREPRLRLEGSAILDNQSSQLSLAQVIVLGSTVSGRATELNVHWGESTHASGNLAYRVNLERGIYWIIPPDWVQGMKTSGELSGVLAISQNAGATVLENSGEIKQWRIEVPPKSGQGSVQTVSYSPSSGVWSEPKISYSQLIRWDGGNDRVAIEKFQADSSALQIAIGGSIEKLSSTGDVALKGQASYDWNRLTPLVSRICGFDLKLAGRRTSNFSLKGPMSDVQLQASATTNQWSGQGDVAWDRAQILGVDIGNTIVRSQLSGSKLAFHVDSPEVSGGRVKMDSNLLLGGDSLEWQIAPGRIVDQVAITPEICQTWLSYVAPIVADATRVEGKLSVQVQSGQFPLENPLAGQSHGFVEVHGAEVRSGPLAQAYVDLARNIESLVRKTSFKPGQESARLLSMPPQKIDYQVAQDRVFHQGLIVQSGDVQMVTSGWVAADQSMQLVAAVPIQDSWVQVAPWLAPMRGKTLSVPIRGTLNQPELDSEVLKHLAGGVINNATQSAIEKGIQKGLQELFRK